MRFGLSEHIINSNCEVLSRFPEVGKTVIYGSREKGMDMPGSDTDITLAGRQLNFRSLNRICLKLDDLLLPYTFDVSLLQQIDNKDLLEHINRKGQLF